jgi:uncharacterized repeat protein (TIGR01451 family)
MNPNRVIWIGTAIATVLLLTVVAIFSPIRIQITFDNQTTAANAGTLNLPTTTPVPPTAVPPTTVPATAIPATPIPSTDVPPTAIPATPIPPTDRPERKTPTPEPATATAIPATVTVVPVTATPALPPQVRITKTASGATVQAGDRFSYTLKVTNSGQGIARDVVVSDDVPAPLTVVDLNSTKGDIVVNGQRVTAYPRTLAPGETQTYTIVVQLPANASAGKIANTAIITTTTTGDDTGDNTSTTTISVTRPRSTQTLETPRLPKTADPTVVDTTLLAYWPLLILALALMGFGVAARRGAFRQQTLAVTVGGLPFATDSRERRELAGFATSIQLDPHDLVRRWHAGTTTADLVQLVAQLNPQADRLAVSIAVQKVLHRAIHRTND